MGGYCSSYRAPPLDPERLERIVARHHLTERQVQKFWKRFNILDRDNDLLLKYEDFDVTSSKGSIKERVILAFMNNEKPSLDREAQKERTRMSFEKYVSQLMLWERGTRQEK